MTARHLFVFVFLSFVFVSAGLLAMGWSIWWLRPIQWLGRYQLFHIVAHFSIFAGVVFLIYPQKHSRLWTVTLGGAVILEIVQLGAGGFVLTRSLLLDSMFDIAVDMMGAAVCWLMLFLRHSTQTYPIPSR